VTLQSISHKHGFQVVSRVMLERPRDYKQDLVDLGCNPDVLSTVTWNSATHAVDVSGSVNLYSKDLTRLPFQFGKVGGYFWCSNNRLTSLDEAPKEVGDNFHCSDNQLTSLDGALRRSAVVSGALTTGSRALMGPLKRSVSISGAPPTV
jgi:hypothetical protein